MSELVPASNFRHPDQPPLVYDIHKSWEQNVLDGPIWWGTYPYKSNYPTEKPYKLLGHQIISPITIAAGPASGKYWTDFYFEWEYGMVMEKTRRSVPRESNPTPNVVIVTEEEEITRDTLNRTLRGTMDEREFTRFKSGTNSFGNPSPSMRSWANRLYEQKKSARGGQLLGCSVTATVLENKSGCSVILGENPPTAVIVETASDMLIAGTAAAIAGAQVIEFNLACPNVTENTEEGEMFQSPQLVSYLFSEWNRRFPNLPAGFKAGLYKDKDQMRRVLATGGDNIGYISLINAIAMEVLDEDGKQIVGAGTRAGTFGPIIRRLAKEEIEWAADIRVREGLHYEIIGGGGITSIRNVDEYLNLGADAVFIAGLAFEHPELAYEYRLAHQTH
jgi:dihydroorotate dehydrogenase